ncbi:MAG: metallophosphoesterase family protein, partial [Candidatus Fimenecus sp.]
MKKMKRTAAKLAAFVLTFALLFTLVPSTLVRSVAASGEVTVGVMNDLHYYPRSLMGSDINAFIEASKLNSTTSYLSDALVDNALNEYSIEARERGLKYLIIPGDLTKNGEYAAHKALAEKLEQFERDTGVEVFVIDGNHDIRNGNAAEFKDGQFVSTRWTEPEEFREIYQNLGYDHAINTFTPPEGEEAGMLSYTADLEGGYRLIALDGACYSADINSKGENKAETRGAYSEALMQWALEQIADAKAKGLTVIGLTHFNLVQHFENEDNLFEAFTIDNWMEVCENFADAGMHFAFTGHIHLSDIASHTSDNGETLTDCSTSTMLSFPCYLRVVTLDNRSPAGDISVTYETVDIDRSRPVIAYGTTYPQPFRLTAFALNFGGDDINQFANNYIRYLLEYELLPNIEEAGSLYLYLAKSLDLDSVIDGLLSSDSGI